jgi:hypothetical protein
MFHLAKESSKTSRYLSRRRSAGVHPATPGQASGNQPNKPQSWLGFWHFLFWRCLFRTRPGPRYCMAR